MPIDFDAVTAPFRMQPGLRRLPDDALQLTPTRPGCAHLSAKLAVLAHAPGQALLGVAGFDPQPALHTLMDQAVREHPDAFDRDGADRFSAHRLGWSVRGVEVEGDGPAALGECLRALPPEMRLAGLLSLALEEDFAVIDGATARIPWLAVCLPSHWSPDEKVGRHFAEVHAPVADNAVLIAAGEHLLRLVTAGDRWERFVWTLTPRPTLDAHPERTLPVAWPDDADAVAAAAYFRTEHQTFIPLAAPMRQAVFTIRIEVRPLAEAVVEPAHAQRLHAALASMSAPVLAYRGLGAARDPLLAWLARRAG